MRTQAKVILILDKQFEEFKKKLYHQETQKSTAMSQNKKKTKKKEIDNDIEALVYQNVIQG